jgi:hypothetical protein
MAELGDIVLVGSGMRYAVLEWIDSSPHGGRNARLIRMNRDGSTSGLTKAANFLHVVETPTFEMGEKVTVGGRSGGYLGTEEGVCRVLMAERRKKLRDDGYIMIDAHVERIPKAILVIENRRV